MKARSHSQQSQVIVYDADRIQQPGPELFDPAHWERRAAVAGRAVGRGRTLLLETGYGPAVLRQYLRGGWPARFSRDRYLFTGFERSRPLAEFRMLAELNGMGLPAPAPLAALCARHGIWYRGWLLMERILQAVPLADLIGDRADDSLLWRRCGAMIGRFHAAGVVHADLNARNILVGQGQAAHLVDFDRARIARGDTAAFRANLARLRRSLEKLWPDPLRAPRRLLEPVAGRLRPGRGVDMTHRPRHPLRVIESRRLTLVAATPELVVADLAGAAAFAEALGAEVPDGWPPDLYDSMAMRFSLEQLRDPSEIGWSLWYLLSKRYDPAKVIGICGFKGKPNRAGSVEIGYSVLRAFRVQGYATEAVARLVVWAFSHQHVVEVTAETLPHLRQSIRVMEKNGFAFQGPGSEHGVVRYALSKSQGR